MTYLVIALVVLGIAALVVAIEKFLKHNPNKAKVIDKAGTEIGEETEKLAERVKNKIQGK